MTRPISNSPHVAARRRRRQGSSFLLRTALALAVVITGAMAFMTARSQVPNGEAKSGVVPVQVAVSGLESGACLSFPPTGGGLKQTVFVDPGHGGMDPGVVTVLGGRQLLEKDLTLAIANRLLPLLRADGYRVVMSRTADTSVTRLSASDSIAGAMTASAVHRDLVARAACANAAGASVLVSIHFDAYVDLSVGGAETVFGPARPLPPQNTRPAGGPPRGPG